MEHEAEIKYLEDQGCNILWDINTHEQEWYDFREAYKGSGGSDCGTILGVNKWKSPFEAFHYHAGMVQQPEFSNEAMTWGTLIEPQIRDVWRHIDPTDIPSYPKRVADGTPIRNVYDINKYITNPNYERLYSSPDGIIPIGEKKYGYDEQNNIIEVGVLDKPGILEIKKLSSYSIKEYGGNFPESYKAQVQSYMLVTGTEYCELIGLIDGGHIIMEIVEADPNYQKLILDKVNDHWDRVIKVREMLARVDMLKRESKTKLKPVLLCNDMMKEAAELMVEIEDYFPPVDHSESVAIFMSVNYMQLHQVQMLPATDIDKAYVRRWNLLNAVNKDIKVELQFIKNNLEVKLFNSGYQSMSLGEGKGKIKFYRRGKLVNPSLYNNSKAVGDEKEVAQTIIKRMDIYEFD